MQEAQTLAELRGHAIEGWHTKGAELERAVREGSEALGRKREKKRALKARANELSAALEQARAEGAAFRAATDAQLQRSGERLGRLEGQLVALATGHGGAGDLLAHEGSADALQARHDSAQAALGAARQVRGSVQAACEQGLCACSAAF